MALPWFRVYVDLLNSLKFHRLSDTLKARLLLLWCLAGRHDGALPSIEVIAFSLRLPLEDAHQTVRELKDAGWIDDTERGLLPHDWDQHQHVSDISTGRVQRFRQKGETEVKRSVKREGTVTRNGSETATETGVKRFRNGIEQTQTQTQTQTQSRADAPANEKNQFEEFQNEYPEPKRRVKVESACHAYVGRIHGKPGEHEKLMAGLTRYKASEQWQRSLRDDGGKFIKTMALFISEGMYLDFPPAADEQDHDEPVRKINTPEELEAFRREEGLI
jgi:hypothetical protein